MKEHRKKINKLVFDTLPSILMFELFYKIIGMVLFLPILIGIFDFSITVSGFSYVTEENIFEFISKPFSVFMLIVLFLFFVIYIYIEICAVCISFNNAIYGKRITFKYLLYQTFLKLKKALYYKNLPILLFSCLFIPILIFGFGSNAIADISVFSYLKEAIKTVPSLEITINILNVLIYILAFLFMFVFNYFLFNNEYPFIAAKKSIKLLITNFKGIVFLFIKIFIYFIPFLVGFGIILVIIYFLILGTNVLPSSVTILFSILIALSVIMLFVLQTIIFISFFGSATILFYKYEDLHYSPIHPDTEKKRHLTPFGKTQNAVFIIVGLLFIGQALMFYLKRDQSLLENVDGSTVVTSHRAITNLAPENSISAINIVIEQMIDYVEIDVQETKDGRIVLLHDSNVKKYTNGKIDKNIWEINYDEIKNVDFGSYYSSTYSDERIATLEEVIEICNGRITLNIELKNNGHSKKLASRVCDIIKEYDYVNKCVVTSQDINFLKEVNELYPDIEIGYLVSIGLGNYLDIEFVDFYSINYNFVTKSLVQKLHSKGQKVHVWTVNSTSDVERLTEFGVDNIISDRALEVKKEVLIRRTKTNFLIGKLMELLSL